MVSRKLRNKTRKLRGGGGCVSKASVDPMSNINVVKTAANKIRSNARTARERNKAEKKAAKKTELELLKKQAEIHAGEYANSAIKRLGISGNNVSGNNSRSYRDALYSKFMSAFNVKIINNVMEGRPEAEGIDEFFESYGKPTEVSNENMNAMMKSHNNAKNK